MLAAGNRAPILNSICANHKQYNDCFPSDISVNSFLLVSGVRELFLN